MIVNRENVSFHTHLGSLFHIMDHTAILQTIVMCQCDTYKRHSYISNISNVAYLISLEIPK